MFELVSEYKAAGDQPQAIRELVHGLHEGRRYQTLLGVTGSGKTFTLANVLARVNRPALVLSHNKTLAAQLYSEFKSFLPNNAVEYFISYYDYYLPESYIPQTPILPKTRASTRTLNACASPQRLRFSNGAMSWRSPAYRAFTA